jgi:hypothetical protein
MAGLGDGGLDANLPYPYSPHGKQPVGGLHKEAGGHRVQVAELVDQALSRAEQLAVQVELALGPGRRCRPALGGCAASRQGAHVRAR